MIGENRQLVTDEPVEFIRTLSKDICNRFHTLNVHNFILAKFMYKSNLFEKLTINQKFGILPNCKEKKSFI